MKTKVEKQGIVPAMKKTLSFLLFLVMLLSITAGIDLSAYAAISGDYEYEILDDGTVEITAYNGSSSELNISKNINGRTVTSIDDGAFFRCECFTITIPDSVLNIGDFAFAGGYYLENIIVDSNNKNYSSLDGVLYNKSKTELVTCPAGKGYGSFEIPNSVTSIGKMAFYECQTLSDVTIPNSVKSIGEMAFEGTNLRNVTIPSSVSSIGNGAFLGLKSIAVDSNNKSYSSLDGVLYNKNKTELIQYPTEKDADYFTVPNGVTSIADSAFYWSYYLREVALPNSLKNIGVGAFSHSRLDSITIPSNVTNIGEKAFFKCDGLGVRIYNKTIKIGENAFSESTVIYGYKGSTAESYAKEYGCRFFALSNTGKLDTPTLKVTVNADGTFTLSWNNVIGATRYGIYMLETDGKYSWIKSTSATSWTTGIAQYGKKYTYKVFAVDDNTSAKSAFSNAVSATNNKKLPPPTPKIIVNSNGSFTLSWNKIVGADHYQIHLRREDGIYSLMATTTATSYKTAIAPYGKKYTYAVIAVNNKNDSAYSVFSASVSATNTKKLQTPSAKATVNANGSFTLSWNKVAGATRYGIYMLGANGKYSWIKSTSATSWTTGTAQYGKKYTYKVFAVNDSNKSADSNFSSAFSATNNKKLQTPSLKVAVNKNGSFKLSWGKVTGATSYQLYIKQANGSYKLMKTTSSTSFTTAVAAKGKTYSYKVRAVTSKNKNATSNYSSVVNAKRK